MASGGTLDGVYAALPTPFDDGGRIEQKALDHLVDYLLSQRLQGIALCTEAGEDPLLDPEERRHLITSVTARVKSKKGVLLSISAPSTREAVELAKLAQQKGVTGVILAPHRLPGIGYRELYRHVDRVAKAVEIPVLLASRPEGAVDMLAPEELATLAKHPTLKGAFVAEPRAASIEPWVKRYRKRDGAAVLSSCALSFSAPAKVGATGSVCGLAILASDHASKLWDAVQKKEQDFVDKLEKKLAPAVDLLGPPKGGDELDGVHRLAARIAQRSLDGSQMAPVVPFALVKEALRLQGHPIKSRVRTPYEPVSGEASERLKGVLRVSGLLS
ncbi:dihydrodipicolinate synthase family protein [Myxococcota bacterium]|nr:dihydrodipicolinate synthase family protein [Myxococcota bacterium]